MRARKGQVLPALLFLLVAIAIMVLMNVNFFLVVRAKNRLMNAVDEAAIAAAKTQGDLLNRIGRLNREHLIMALENRDEWSEERQDEIEYLVSTAPAEECANATSAAAAEWGMSGVGLEAGYEEVDGALKCAPFMSQGFYDAIASRSWCWFSIGGRSRYLDYDPAGTIPECEQYENVGNSSRYSIHVTFKSWNESEWYDRSLGGLPEEWTNFICKVTGKTRADIANSRLIADSGQRWAFFDATWERRWSDTFSPDKDFPIAGPVREVYDLVGCSAQCRVYGQLPDMMHAEARRELRVTAEAKPFGSVENLDGEIDKVTAFRSFIIPSSPMEKRIFTEAQLVIVGSVPHVDAVSTEPEWKEFYTVEFPAYLSRGAEVLNSGNYYSRQLLYFSDGGNRADIKAWLNANQGSCAPAGGGEEKKGGYDCAH